MNELGLRLAIASEPILIDLAVGIVVLPIHMILVDEAVSIVVLVVDWSVVYVVVWTVGIAHPRE